MRHFYNTFEGREHCIQHQRHAITIKQRANNTANKWVNNTKGPHQDKHFQSIFEFRFDDTSTIWIFLFELAIPLRQLAPVILIIPVRGMLDIVAGPPGCLCVHSARESTIFSTYGVSGRARSSAFFVNRTALDKRGIVREFAPCNFLARPTKWHML